MIALIFVVEMGCHMRKIGILAMLLGGTICAAAEPNFHDFDRYQYCLSREDVENKIQEYLLKDLQIEEYFALTADALAIYSTPEMKEKREPEYVLRFGRQENKAIVSPQNCQMLRGLKIALDPGHFGGKMARLEERFVDIEPNQEMGIAEPIEFDEGTLTFLTAFYLKELLEKEGAEVLLTRNEIGLGAYPEEFFAWLRENPQFHGIDIPPSQIFRRHYNPLDLQARAEKINQFAPDLTLIIHYNAHDSQATEGGGTGLSLKNYNMTFIPGAFARGELSTPQSRYEFLRLIVKPDIQHSSALSCQVLQQFVQKLQVPAVTKEDGARYLETVCLKVDEGVYARNLALTRMVRGTVCYGESLVQNNIEECKRLAQQDILIYGRPCSSRIKEVAEAYFAAIQGYTDSRK